MRSNSSKFLDFFMIPIRWMYFLATGCPYAFEAKSYLQYCFSSFRVRNMTRNDSPHDFHLYRTGKDYAPSGGMSTNNLPEG
jgi:hypothetical protein